MGSFTVDTADFPLVRVTYEGHIDDNAFARHLEEYARLLERGQRYAVVFDATRAARPPAGQRRMQADFIRAHSDELGRLCVGGAFAINSTVVRGAMTAILWLSPMPFPYEICPDVDSAVRWTTGRLRETGLVP